MLLLHQQNLAARPTAEISSPRDQQPKPSGAQARDTIQQEMSAAAAEGRPRRAPGGSGSQPAVRYSRLDSDIAAMQRDSGTYCDEPEDTEAYAAWLKVCACRAAHAGFAIIPTGHRGPILRQVASRYMQVLQPELRLSLALVC